MKTGGIGFRWFLFLFVALGFALSLLFLYNTYAFDYEGDIPNPGHPGDSVWISIEGEEMSLQDAIDQGLLASSTTTQIIQQSGDGLTSKVKGFASAGLYDSTCLLLTNEKVVCTGYNGYGQLGTGDTSQRVYYREISGLSGVKKLVVGAGFYCALLDDKSIECWGYNGYGQLGDGTKTNRYVPTKVLSVNNGFLDSDLPNTMAKDIFVRESWSGTAMADYVCALTVEGRVYCWGYNNDKYLFGDGVTKASSSAPNQPVSGLTNVVDVQLGGHGSGGWGCALLTDGKVKCWGYNGYGQLGDGTKTTPKVPVDWANYGSSGSFAKQVITTGTDFGTSCVLLGGTDDGKVMCSGYNTYGQLGTGDTSAKSGPVYVGLIGGLALPKATRLFSSGAGNQYSSFCALLVDKTVACWGYNGYGGIGLPNVAGNIYSSPSRIPGLNDVSDLVINAWTGVGSGCALLTDGKVKCWGYNGYGQLGDGTKTNRYVPVDVRLDEKAKRIFMGGTIGNSFYTCALLEDDSIKCWGYNGYGQLGTGDKITQLTPVAPK